MTDLVKVVEINGEEFLVIESKETEKVEYRLYYDENGYVLFYTCDKPAGNYIVVDQNIYSEMRHDWRVIDGKLTKLIPGIMITKLKPSTTGIYCASEDVSIVVDETFTDKQQWELTSYELR